MAQRKVPGLQSQLEEFKSALCQLQAQKQRLQTEVGHTVTMTTEGFTLITGSVFFIPPSQYLKKDILTDRHHEDQSKLLFSQIIFTVNRLVYKMSENRD